MTNEIIEMEPEFTDRVAEIKWHEAQAEDLAQRSDTHRWRAAELIVAELETGKTQRALAKELGMPQPRVNEYARVWRTHGGDTHVYQSFDQLRRERQTPKINVTHNDRDHAKSLLGVHGRGSEGCSRPSEAR